MRASAFPHLGQLPTQNPTRTIPLGASSQTPYSLQRFLTAFSVAHVDDSFNGCWSWALYASEGEIPSFAAMMTIEETKNSIAEDSQTGIGRLLVEKVFLWKLIRKQKQR